MTQPPSARLPGTLQQLEPPLLQERKAFVPQCQGCQGKREAGRLPLPGGTQDGPQCPKDFSPAKRQGSKSSPTLHQASHPKARFFTLGPSSQMAP